MLSEVKDKYVEPTEWPGKLPIFYAYLTVGAAMWKWVHHYNQKIKMFAVAAAAVNWVDLVFCCLSTVT